MTRAVPWSIKGVDFETREAAKEAARKAGLSVGDWLNEAIADKARERGMEPEDFDDEDRLEAVTARLGGGSARRAHAAYREEWRDEDVEPPRRRRIDPAPRDRGDPRDGGAGRMARPESADAEGLLHTAIRLYERGAEQAGGRAHAVLDTVARRLNKIEDQIGRSRGGDEDARLERIERRLERLAAQRAAETFADAPAAPPAPRQSRDEVERIESKLNSLIDYVHNGVRRPDAAVAPAPVAQRPLPRRFAPVGQRPASDPLGEIARRRDELSGARRAAPEMAYAGPHYAAEPVVAPAAPERDQAIQELRADIAALARNIEEMRRPPQAERVVAPAEPQAPADAARAEIVALTRRLDDIKQHIATQAADTRRALAAHADEWQRSAPRSPEFDALRRRIDEMTRALAEVAPRGAVASLDGAIRTLGERVEKSLRSGSSEELMRPLGDLAKDLRTSMGDLARDVRDNLGKAANADSMASIERAIRELSERVVQPRADAIDARSIAEIQSQTAEIRDLLKRAAAQSGPSESIERHIARLADRLATAPAAALEPVADSMRASPNAMIELLAKRIDDLGHKIDDAVSQAGASDQLDEIARGLQDVRNSMARPAASAVGPADTGNLERMMRDIAARLDHAPTSASIDATQVESLLRSLGDKLSSGTGVHDAGMLVEMRDAIALLSDKIDRGQGAGVDTRAIDDLRDQIAHLALRIDATPSGVAGHDGIDGLRDGIADLSARVERVNDGARALNTLEATIADLSTRIDDARHIALEAAETAARNAARAAITEAMGRMPAAAPAAAPIDGDILRDLSDLRSMNEAIDKRTQSTLMAVHETLEKVVDRIATIEDEIGEERRRSDHTLASGAAPVFAPAAATTPPVQPVHAAPRVAPPPPLSVDPIDHFDELIEPVAAGNAPDPRPALPGDLDKATANRGSDARRLLEAARRAAQANTVNAKPGRATGGRDSSAVDDQLAEARARAIAAHAAMTQGKASAPASGEAGTSILAKVSNFARARRYPLVAVGVLAIASGSAWQLFGRSKAPPPRPAIVEDARPAPAPVAPPPLVAPEPEAPQAAAPPPPPPAPAVPVRPAGQPGQSAGRGGVDAAPVSSINSLPTLAARGTPTNLASAAASGDALAQYEMGARYADGRSVARDPAQAIEWLTKAAQQNFAPAQYRLGSLYERGAVGGRDTKKAREWYERAAAGGNVRAMHNLAVLTAEGTEGKPDYATAASWFKKAAEYGVRDSQYNLAILYARGLGIEQNLSQSWAWFSIAAAQGDSEAAKKQDDVGSRLDSKQLDAAKAFVTAFKPKTPDKMANDPPPPPGGWEANAAKADARPLSPSPATPPKAPASKGKVTSL